MRLIRWKFNKWAVVEMCFLQHFKATVSGATRQYITFIQSISSQTEQPEWINLDRFRFEHQKYLVIQEIENRHSQVVIYNVRKGIVNDPELGEEILSYLNDVVAQLCASDLSLFKSQGRPCISNKKFGVKMEVSSWQ